MVSTERSAVAERWWDDLGIEPLAAAYVLRFAAPAEWLNANKRYKRRPGELIRAWRTATAQHAAAQGLPRGLTRVSVFATLHFTDRRPRDAHNFMLSVKSCIDGLVDHGLIPDDRREHLHWTAVTEGDPIPKKPYGPPGEIELLIAQTPPIRPLAPEPASLRDRVTPKVRKRSQRPPGRDTYATTGGI